MIILEKLRDKNCYTGAEVEVVDYILNNPEAVIKLTIDELARVSYSSPSSIVRLCKKLGFKGFSDFKIKLAVEINTFIINHTRIEVDMPVPKGAKSEEIAQNLLNLHYQTLNDVYHSIDLKELEKAADMLWESDFVMFRGIGPSLLIAEDFFYKFRRFGIACECIAMTGFETQVFVSSPKHPVMLIVSHYATTISIRNLIHEALAAKIRVILVTCNRESPLNKLVHLSIVVDSGEPNRMTKQGSFASRTGMSYTLDIIYTMVFAKNYDQNVKVLYDFQGRNGKRDVYINELKYLNEK